MTERNLGIFVVKQSFVRENPEIVAEIFSIMKCVPVGMRYLFCTDEIEYTAISEKFEEAPEGVLIPIYRLLIKIDEENNLEAVETLRI